MNRRGFLGRAAKALIALPVVALVPLVARAPEPVAAAVAGDPGRRIKPLWSLGSYAQGRKINSTTVVSMDGPAVNGWSAGTPEGGEFTYWYQGPLPPKMIEDARSAMRERALGIPPTPRAQLLRKEES